MSEKLTDKLLGPYFKFIEAPRVENWKQNKEKGWSLIENKLDYFHHPKSIKVQDSIISLVVLCFINSNSKFNYYGDTEFYDENLRKLIEFLEVQVLQIKGCVNKNEFKNITTNLFEHNCEESIKDWKKIPKMRNEIVEILDEILALAKKTHRTKGVLLVLGV